MVGPHINKENYIYSGFPPYIKNERNWNNSLEEINGYIHVNLEQAIRNQLQKQHILEENIIVSNIDTATDARLYSNNRARFDENKKGRFYTGCFYGEGESNVKVFRKNNR